MSERGDVRHASRIPTVDYLAWLKPCSAPLGASRHEAPPIVHRLHSLSTHLIAQISFIIDVISISNRKWREIVSSGGCDGTRWDQDQVEPTPRLKRGKVGSLLGSVGLLRSVLSVPGSLASMHRA